MVRVRFVQADFPHHLERMRSRGGRIRNKAMRDLQAVNIRLVLLPSAVAVDYRLGQEAEYRDDQQKHGQRRPVRRVPNAPVASPARDHPTNDLRTEEQKHEQHQRQPEKRIADMAENIMAHLVAKYSERFGRGELLKCGIPNHDALRSAESADVSV